MGKKSKIKALNKKNATDDVSDDENDDETIGTTEDCPGTPVRPKSESATNVSEIVEKLTDKRYTTRENGLELLIKHFQSSHSASEHVTIGGFQDTILTHLLRIIRRPFSAKEGKLCTQLLSLIGLFLGPDEDEFFTNFERPLRALIDGASPELQDVRGPALTCLTILTFICGGVDAGYRIWSYCERILNEEALAIRESSSSDSDASSDDDDDRSQSSEESSSHRRTKPSSSVSLRAAAAESWVLLSTLRSPEEILTHCQGEGNSLLEPLLELLQFHDGTGLSSIEVKVTAGKCIAYLWEVADESEGSAGSSPTELGYLLCSDVNTVQQILDSKLIMFLWLCTFVVDQDYSHH